MRACAKVAVELGRVVALCVECIKWAKVSFCSAHVVVVKVVNYFGW